MSGLVGLAAVPMILPLVPLVMPVNPVSAPMRLLELVPTTSSLGQDRCVIVRDKTVVVSVTLAPDERVVSYSCGGGGFGDPKTRAVEKVLNDVREGRIGGVSSRFYGVPTEYSQRKTNTVDAPAILEFCREDAVDAVVLVGL